MTVDHVASRSSTPMRLQSAARLVGGSQPVDERAACNPARPQQPPSNEHWRTSKLSTSPAKPLKPNWGTLTMLSWMKGSGIFLLGSGTTERVNLPVPEQMWSSHHRTYWNRIANEYDSMYQGPWSQLENDAVARSLSFLEQLKEPIVLDVGCGTGLGYELAHKLKADLRYIGVDISEKMLHQCTGSTFRVQGDMNNLSFVRSNAVDVVTLLYTTASYSPDLRGLMDQIARILRPGGYAYVSALSRPHIRGRRRAVLDYRSRGDNSAQYAYVPARTYSMRSLRKIGRQAGLSFVSDSGINTFSGRLENRAFWRIGEITAKLVPQISHTIAAVFQRKTRGVK
jgi:SAM-dependent methyltransferase